MFISIAVFFTYSTVQIAKLPAELSKRVDPILDRVHQRDDQVKAVLKDVSSTMEDNYWDTKANIETSTVILRDISEITKSLRSELLPDLIDAVKGLRSLTKEIENDARKLSASGDETIKATTALVRQLNSLTAQLEVEIKQGSPKALQTIDSIDKLVVDIDKHINNPDLYAITNNVKEITGNTSEITKTVDVATRPLREKVKLVKLVLLRLIGMIRVQPF